MEILNSTHRQKRTLILSSSLVEKNQSILIYFCFLKMAFPISDAVQFIRKNRPWSSYFGHSDNWKMLDWLCRTGSPFYSFSKFSSTKILSIFRCSETLWNFAYGITKEVAASNRIARTQILMFRCTNDGFCFVRSESLVFSCVSALIFVTNEWPKTSNSIHDCVRHAIPEKPERANGMAIRIRILRD